MTWRASTTDAVSVRGQVSRCPGLGIQMKSVDFSMTHTNQFEHFVFSKADVNPRTPFPGLLLCNCYC